MMSLPIIKNNIDVYRVVQLDSEFWQLDSDIGALIMTPERLYNTLVQSGCTEAQHKIESEKAIPHNCPYIAEISFKITANVRLDQIEGIWGHDIDKSKPIYLLTAVGLSKIKDEDSKGSF